MRDSHPFIWRLADDYGRGPYAAASWSFLDAHPSIWRTHADAAHPSPAREVMAGSPRQSQAMSPGLFMEQEQAIPGNLRDRMDMDNKWWKFGHRTVEQARLWWSRKDVQWADRAGASYLEVYAVSDALEHLDGKHQTVFRIPNREEGERIPDPAPLLRLPVMDLCNLSVAALNAMASDALAARRTQD